jgi:hypothetical protein
MKADFKNEHDPELDKKVDELVDLLGKYHQKQALKYSVLIGFIWAITYYILKNNFGFNACKIWVAIAITIGLFMTVWGVFSFNKGFFKIGLVVFLGEIIVYLFIFQFKIIPF